MLADFEKRIAFAFIHLLELEDIFVKGDRFGHIVHLDREMINSINSHAHSVSNLTGSRRLSHQLEGTALSVPRGSFHKEIRLVVRGSDDALPFRGCLCFKRGVAFRQRKHPVHQPITERFNEAPIIFLTVCTRNRKRILANSEVVVLLRDSWHQATSWTVGRFIVMPDHLHLFCAPVENITHPLSQWVRYWKTVASRSWPRPQEQPVWQLDFLDTQQPAWNALR